MYPAYITSHDPRNTEVDTLFPFPPSTTLLDMGSTPPCSRTHAPSDDESDVADEGYFSGTRSSASSDGGTPSENPTIRQRQKSSNDSSALDRQVQVKELKEANTADRAWVAVRGKVYNLTEFAARHPGGQDIILMAAGKDITPLFETSHGPKEHRTLQKFLVGSLVGRDLPGFPPPDEFAVTLKRRVAAHFTAEGIDPKHSLLSYVRYVVTLVVLVALYTLQWVPMSTTAFYVVAVAYGLVQSQYACSAVHDGSHGAIGHNPFVWRLLVAGQDFINGTSGTLWIYQHVLGHHPYTNIEDCDTDIDTSGDVAFRRIKPSQKWVWIYRLQAVYAPMFYIFLGTAVRFEDVYNAYIIRRRGVMVVNPFTTLQTAVFWGGKAFFLLTRLIFPFIYTSIPAKHIIGAFLVADFVFSFTLAIIFQASHVVEDVDWPLPDPDTGDIEMDWMRLQVETAQDYAHDQPWTTFLVGALNYQVVHHLFPHVAQPYLKGLGPIVKEAAREFGVKYEIKGTLYEAIGGHIGLLKMMGEPPHSH